MYCLTTPYFCIKYKEHIVKQLSNNRQCKTILPGMLNLCEFFSGYGLKQSPQRNATICILMLLRSFPFVPEPAQCLSWYPSAGPFHGPCQMLPSSFAMALTLQDLYAAFVLIEELHKLVRQLDETVALQAAPIWHQEGRALWRLLLAPFM